MAATPTKTPRSAMRGSRAAATPPRRSTGKKRGSSDHDHDHDHDHNHNHDHNHDHDHHHHHFDATPSPTIRQPRQKAAILQLPPRPVVPLGNNEETLLPLYTPELGRSVRRLEHNYHWDTKWLAELHRAMANAEALHLMQTHLGDLDHETGVTKDRVVTLSRQTAASL